MRNFWFVTMCLCFAICAYAWVRVIHMALEIRRKRIIEKVKQRLNRSNWNNYELDGVTLNGNGEDFVVPKNCTLMNSRICGLNVVLEDHAEVVNCTIENGSICSRGVNTYIANNIIKTPGGFGITIP